MTYLSNSSETELLLDEGLSGTSGTLGGSRGGLLEVGSHLELLDLHLHEVVSLFLSGSFVLSLVFFESVNTVVTVVTEDFFLLSNEGL